MKKIPTLFERDWDGNRALVTRTPHPDCDWVFRNEGTATRKWDGTCCLVRDGVLYKRYDARVLPRPKFNQEKRSVHAKEPKAPPPEFIPADEPDYETGHWPGWLPVGDGPEDAYYREAVAPDSPANCGLLNGTYELMGPKVQGNPDGYEEHVLLRHGSDRICAPQADFDLLKEYLEGAGMEGIVWHHPDGRMAKLKSRDFGIQWPPKVTP